MRKIAQILPHITIGMAGMFIIFWILDILNPTMNLINRQLSNKLLLIFCIFAIITSAFQIYYERISDKINSKKADKKDSTNQ